MHASNEVIMPVLGMNQDTGKIVRWLAGEGQPVKQGQPLLEVETDKAVAEIEAPATGTVSQVTAQAGEDVPVGRVIAVILPTDPGDTRPAPAASRATQPPVAPPAKASPLAARIAADHNVDLQQIKTPSGGRVKKADVLAFLDAQEEAAKSPSADRPLASPKARRLAAERGLDLGAMRGSGPEGAVLAGDVEAFALGVPQPVTQPSLRPGPVSAPVPGSEPATTEITPNAIWRIMAERTTAAWQSTPHFFLIREVDATRLIGWREVAQKDSAVKVTYTDLLVKAAAAALHKHSRLNAAFVDNKVRLFPQINIGVAVALEEGVVVPVIQRTDKLGVSEIAAARAALVDKARAGRLHPEDLVGGTFTVSNLGMYGVDAFLAILNPPQSAILAVGRIVDRVVPLNGRPTVRPTLTLSLSFDHRAVDGAHGAQFLDTLGRFIEEPLGLMS